MFKMHCGGKPSCNDPKTVKVERQVGKPWPSEKELIDRAQRFLGKPIAAVKYVKNCTYWTSGYQANAAMFRLTYAPLNSQRYERCDVDGKPLNMAIMAHLVECGAIAANWNG